VAHDGANDPQLTVQEHRARAAGQVAALQQQFDAIVDASRDSAADDEHDPDGATIGFERAQVAALLARARARVAELDEALARVHDEHYGRCDGCGRPIGAERLAALPATTTCVECAAAGAR
jgi:RNA polymerase-binding transcription factor DksA